MNLTWVRKFQHVERPKICAGMIQKVENENEPQIGFQLEKHFPMLGWSLEPNAQLHCEID